MKRILSLIGVVLVVGCGPEPRDLETLQFRRGLYMNPSDGQPYSGPVFTTEDGGGTRRTTGSLKDGVEDGLWSFFTRDGQLEFKGTIKDREWCGGWLEEGETVS